MWNVLRVDAAARDSAVISHAGHTPHWADIRLFLFFYYLLVVLLKNTTTGNNISFSQNGLKIISASAAVFLQHPLRPSHNVWSFDALIFVCVCVCVSRQEAKSRHVPWALRFHVRPDVLSVATSFFLPISQCHSNGALARATLNFRYSL